jgi:hypothetical protein
MAFSRHPGSPPILFLSAFTPAQPDVPDIVSSDTVSDTLVPVAVPPRPPFTLTATLFGALRASLFEARMLPADFCNCLRRTDEKPGALVSSQGRWP